MWQRVYTKDMTRQIKRGKRVKNNSRQKDAVQAAIDWGIDVSMLSDNMRRSYAERIRRHQIALDTVEKLRKAKHR